MTNIISNLGIAGNVIGVVAGSVPVFFIAILILRRVFPQIDPYLTKAKPVIAEVDDLLDSILLEWDNNTLSTVNDVVGQIRADLNRAGYKLDDIDDQKITNHTKAELKRQAESPNGLSIDRDENGGLKVNYKKEF